MPSMAAFIVTSLLEPSPRFVLARSFYKRYHFTQEIIRSLDVPYGGDVQLLRLQIKLMRVNRSRCVSFRFPSFR